MTKSLSFLAVALGFMACQPTPPPPQAAAPMASLPPLVQPPLPHLNPAFTTFKVQAEQGGRLTLPSGTQIRIPKNAFKGKNGDILRGEVAVQYREMPTALSIYLAGIPMLYRGVPFTTAGTFEIRAQHNGEMAEIADNQSIEVRYASATAGQNYDFFYLDETQKRGWDSVGTAAPEVVERTRRTVATVRTLPPFFAFDYTALVDVYVKADWSVMSDKKRLDSTFQAISPKLSRYGLQTWNIQDKNRRSYILLPDSNYYLSNLLAWRLLSGEMPKGTIVSYAFSSENSRQKATFYTETDSAVCEIEAIMPLRTLFAFSPESWEKEADKNWAVVKQEAARQQTVRSIYRTFAVQKMGIYNWDKLMDTDGRVEIAGQFDFNTPLNNNITDLDVIYISGDNRIVMTFPKAVWPKMALQLDKKARLFAVLPNQTIALFAPRQYAQLPFEQFRQKPFSPYLFKMELKGEVRTEADLKQLLQI